MKVTVDDQSYQVEVAADVIAVDGDPYRVQVEAQGEAYRVQVEGASFCVRVLPSRGNPLTVYVDGSEHRVSFEEPLGTARQPWHPSPPAGEVVVAAQMRGRVVALRAVPGVPVAAGDLLLILEAMKMENEIRSPRAGTVREVAVATGDLVGEGDVLVVLD